MKVLLINAATNYVMEKSPVPLGLLSIATFLNSRGHTTRIYDRATDGTGLKTVIRAFPPDIVGISLISTKGLNDAKRLTAFFCKKCIPVVWGGPAASLIPHVILKNTAANYVISGDGEKPMLALVQALNNGNSPENIPGLAFTQDGQVRANDRDLHADLSDLPALDWSLIDTRRYILKNVYQQKMLHTFTSKGCIGSCGYCYNPSFSRGIWRPRSMQAVLNEMHELARGYDVQAVTFVDDLLRPDKDSLSAFCKTIKREGPDLYWGCDLCADSVTREELEEMYDAGCRWIFFGIESGSPEMQKIIKKNLDLQKAKTTLEICKEIGICTTTSFIVGFPDETKEDLKQTVAYANSLPSDVKVAFSFGPIPTTLLYRRLVNEKRLKACDEDPSLGTRCWFDFYGENYTVVPALDCKVIVSCFYFAMMASQIRFGGEEKKHWGKRFVSQIGDMLRMKSLRGMKRLCLSVLLFSKILFYSLAFPRIRKEYGLQLRRRG